MNCRFRCDSRFVMLLVALSLTTVGCGRSHKDYVPSVNDARKALEAALTGWQNGAKSGEPIQPADKPGMTVDLFDGDFAGGRKLEKWEIESVGSNTEGPREFTVKLTVAGAAQGQTATYFVTGVSGRFSVFRDREYQQRASQM